jgi:hypothetical protein
MLIEQMDNDVDIPPDLTDRTQRTFANANGLPCQTLGAQGLGSPQIPRPGTTPSLTLLWCAPKRLHLIAMRNASLPTAAVALRSRRTEWLGRRKREKALRRAAGGRGGMQVDS